MPRRIPLAALLLVSAAARAQDAPAPALAPADSLPRLPHVTITGLLTTDQLPALAPTVQDQLRRVPGVQVTPFSGAPGADAVLRVRSAVNVLHPTQPLFEVDGLPALALTFGLFSTSPDFPLSRDFNPLLLLAPVSLDSVSVHTGAAATARYGLLGAGGVVGLQTAQGGPVGKPLQISYAAQLTAQQLRRAYPLLEAREYAALTNEASPVSSYPPRYSTDELARLGRGTDWQDELYNLGLGTDHQLRLRGEQANTRYAAQLGYLHQNGIMHNSWLSRYHAGLSVEQRLGHLDLHASALGTQLDERRPDDLAVAGALLSAPTIPVRDASGAYSVTTGFRPPEYLLHPLQLAEEMYTSPRTRLLLTRLAATYHLDTDWQFSLRGGYDRVTQATQIQEQVLTGTTAQQFTFASQHVGERTHKVQALVGRAEARYQHSFGDQHLVAGSLSYDYQRPRYSGRYQVDYPPIPGVGPTGASASSYNRPDGLHNALATARYVLRGAYEWQASLWTTRLSKITFVYPGGQFTWRAEQLPALQNKAWLSELHLWAGAGQSAAGLYDQNSLRSGPSYIIIGSGGSLPPMPPAEFFAGNRRQVRTTHAEVGATLGLWQQRLRLGLTAFRRQTNHVPVFAVASYQNYAYLVVDNALSLRNQGLELSAESRWQAGRLRGQTRLAASTTGNEVTRAPEQAYPQTIPAQQQLGTVVGLQQDGLYPDGPRIGTIRYQSEPGYSYPNPAQPLGGGAPRHTLSLWQRLTRGRLSLDVQADAMSGYQVFNSLLAAVEVPSGYYNSSTAVRDRWTPTNQQTSTPRAGTTLAPPYAQPTPTPNSRALSSGAHLRLTEVLLSYRLPTALPLTVYGGGRNLAVLTRYQGYDPNVSSAGADAARPMFDQMAYPVPRTWLLGLNAEF